MNNALLYHLQNASITLGLFVCLWGLTEFWKCLIEVLMGKHNFPTNSRCPQHAGAAVVCIIGILFCAARANTIGLLPWGFEGASWAFMGGMIGFCMIVSLAIWSKSAAHAVTNNSPGFNHPALARIFSMMLIIIMSFILVGLLSTGR